MFYTVLASRDKVKLKLCMTSTHICLRTGMHLYFSRKNLNLIARHAGTSRRGLCM